jgi:hypothetical protein
MITLQGFSLIAELAASIWLTVALAGFGISRSKPWLMGSAVAFIALMVAVTMLIESSST